MAAAPDGKTVNGVAYGPSGAISGIWFTNFEHSEFLECSGKACDDGSGKWASIHCVDDACKRLDEQALRLTGRPLNSTPEGEFEIRFVGRRALGEHPPRYVGGGERDVLIEQVISLAVAPKRASAG